ncbi:hypothetical protein [Hufsiella ginkgonis]|uniref:Uncharacterized protein n=1 Tax=Hufsiella ginkgonis TaxID=2695274 RepID=A0A7K1XTX9_9SPHI|nr:hypothetical protein [Hufsiella ginkgonis]MXV14268.1 hypothetical protein [Hufsiella ginkgonis]
MICRVILFIWLFLPLLAFGQNARPDTLQLDMKLGSKVILIGTDLDSFRNIKLDSLVRKALEAVKDSISPEGKTKKPVSRDQLYTRIITKNQPFRLKPAIGASLVKETPAPLMGLYLEFAPQRQDYYLRDLIPEYTFLHAGISALYLSERNQAGVRVTNVNVFAEGSIGNRYNNEDKRVFNFDEFSFGLGYLVRRRGDYFEKNTFKLFGTIVPSRSFIRLKPELYVPGNLKKIFPGLSVLVLLKG